MSLSGTQTDIPNNANECVLLKIVYLSCAMKTENGTFYRYLYGRLTDSRSDLGTAMDGYGYDDTEMERGGQGKV